MTDSVGCSCFQEQNDKEAVSGGLQANVSVSGYQKADSELQGKDVRERYGYVNYF